VGYVRTEHDVDTDVVAEARRIVEQSQLHDGPS
jgi:hypothetical protein